jgi:U32 family peptidase
MNKIELLAPGGSLESMYAAVQSGCDAIYMGGSKFSARAYANNFGDEELIKAVDYCHLYGVKVYIALNTLIKESEMKEAIDYARFLYTIGVDALIIQDLGIFSLIKASMPDFEIHASTQMTIHNGEGALLLRDLGFKRIVLSRELSLKEIKYISTDLGVETEVFVHGALCICYSGQCLMSSVIGGRSGNRGRCAQPCRLPYTIINKGNEETREGYLLSPKDMCTIDEIKGLIESNTSSLKIEGRMKKPEYVSGVVSSYREAIESVYNKIDYDSSNHKETLTQLFNREGFSKAYLHGNAGKDMMAYSFPKNTGVLLGKANRDLSIKLLKDISLGDGVRINHGGFNVTSIIKGKEKVDFAKKGEVVYLKPSKYKADDDLYVTSDTKLMENLAKNYENIYGKKIPLVLQVKVKVNEPLVLIIDYEHQHFEAMGDIVQVAQKRPLDKESLIKNLNKLGDTPFEFKHIEFSDFEEGFLPVSSINSVRRELIDKILEFIVKKYKKKSINYTGISLGEENNFKNKEVSCNRENVAIRKENNLTEEINKKDNNNIPDLLICVSNNEQLTEVINFIEEEMSGGKYKNIGIAVDLFTMGNDIKIHDIKYNNLYIKAPNVIKEEFQAICTIIEDNLSKVKGIVTANLGIFNRFKGRTSIIGDYKLNIFNHNSYNFYSNFTDLSAVSIELNGKELKELSQSVKAPMQVMVYGKYELMISEYCVIGSTFGGKSVDKGCKANCAKENFTLRDRMGEEFILKTDKYCRSHIYNHVAVNLVPHMKELRKVGYNFFRVDFVDEDLKKVSEVLKMVTHEVYEGDYKEYTRGHYKRGVE